TVLSILDGGGDNSVSDGLQTLAKSMIQTAVSPPDVDAAIRQLRDMGEKSKVMLSRAVTVVLEGGEVIKMAPAIKKTSAMVNVCYDFHRWSGFGQWGITPFVCGGIGGALMNWSENSVNRMNYGIKGGLNYAFYRNVTGIVSVSYGGTMGKNARVTMPVLHMADSTLPSGTKPPEKARGWLKTSMGLSTLGVEVGLRLGF
ncbi:MAG: P44/Msp2 family outer membrane protein, partial [Anaplasma sp.]